MSKRRILLGAVIIFAFLLLLATYLDSLLAHAPVRSSQPTPSLIQATRPDPNLVPLYPGARDVQTQYFDSASWTDYVVDAGPQAIEEFYRSDLPKAGWLLDPESKTIDTDSGILFVYLLPNQPGPRTAGGHLAIRSTKELDGQTKVHLQVFGDGVVPPGKAQP